MNKAIIIGRLTRDPESRMTQSQIPVCSFTLAVDRRFKNAAGEKQADFIPIVAWRQQAEFAAKYFRKGSKMIVVGSIQTRKYDKDDGTTVYVTEIVADEIEFGESKKQDEPGHYEPAPNTAPADGVFPVSDDDTQLPFDL